MYGKDDRSGARKRGGGQIRSCSQCGAHTSCSWRRAYTPHGIAWVCNACGCRLRRQRIKQQRTAQRQRCVLEVAPAAATAPLLSTAGPPASSGSGGAQPAQTPPLVPSSPTAHAGGSDSSEAAPPSPERYAPAPVGLPPDAFATLREWLAGAAADTSLEQLAACLWARSMATAAELAQAAGGGAGGGWGAAPLLPGPLLLLIAGALQPPTCGGV
eukprot:scaffold12.g8069.t1